MRLLRLLLHDFQTKFCRLIFLLQKLKSNVKAILEIALLYHMARAADFTAVFQIA